MKKIISIKDLDIVQKNFQQMVIRGKMEKMILIK